MTLADVDFISRRFNFVPSFHALFPRFAVSGRLIPHPLPASRDHTLHTRCTVQTALEYRRLPLAGERAIESPSKCDVSPADSLPVQLTPDTRGWRVWLSLSFSPETRARNLLVNPKYRESGAESLSDRKTHTHEQEKEDLRDSTSMSHDSPPLLLHLTHSQLMTLSLSLSQLDLST